MAHAYEQEQVRGALARVQELNAKSGKHQRIRVNHWVRKLLDQPVSNPAWLKNVMEHVWTLEQMLLKGIVEDPFTKMPPQGPLPLLPRHKVAHLVGKLNGRGTDTLNTHKSRGGKSTAQHLERLLQVDHIPQAYGSSEEKKKKTQSKQVQTSDQDDQWEWQRVWKGAFEKMRTELQDKNAQIGTMVTEMKELRTLVAAQKRALEQEQRVRDDLLAKQRAEVENLRSVHALEIDSLKARHKKQIEEAILQNDRLLRERRREVEPGAAFNMQSESYGDFLAYIDDFYADTLHLTRTA